MVLKAHFDSRMNSNIAVSKNEMKGEGSLFVVVLGPLKEVGNYIAEVGVDTGNGVVSIGSLTQHFVGSECKALAGRPKVFLFVDTKVGRESAPTTVNTLFNFARFFD
jgi:hypothetical protein